MEIIENSPEVYRDQLLTALQAGNTNLLRALKSAKDKKRLVFLNTITGMNAYQHSKGDCLLFSATVADKLENDWIGSVLNGNPITPPFGFTPSIPEHEILSIYAKIEAEI